MGQRTAATTGGSGGGQVPYGVGSKPTANMGVGVEPAWGRAGVGGEVGSLCIAIN